jgi:hypothetical protein
MSFLVTLLAVSIQTTTPDDYKILDLIAPFTLMQLSGFLSFAFFLELIRNKVSKIKKTGKTVIIVIMAFIILASLFETLWVFNYWISNYEVTVAEGAPNHAGTLEALKYIPAPDIETAHYKLRADKIYFVRTARKHTLVLMSALYFIYYLVYINKEENL